MGQGANAMKIYQKLGISFLILIVLILTVSIVGLFEMHQIQSIAAKIDDNLDSIVTLNNLKNSLYENQIQILNSKTRSQPVNQTVLKSNLEQIHKNLLEYDTFVTTEEGAKLAAKLKDTINEYEKFLTDSLKADPSGRTVSDTTLTEKFNNIKIAMVRLLEHKNHETNILDQESANIYTMSIYLLIGISVAAVIFAIIIAMMISLSIRRKLATINQKVLDIAENGGDLTQQIILNGNDEINSLAMGINALIEKIRSMMLIVKENSTKINAMSSNMKEINKQTAEVTNQIAVAINDIAAGSTDIAENVQNAFSSLEELKINLNDAASGFAQVNEVINITMAKVDEGKKAIIKQDQLMGSNKNTINNTKTSLDNLASKLNGITDFLAIIQTIAEQTNLLALNAAIEAARAGESGRGFAVVAQEVRKLAEQSGKAAQQIQENINDLLTVAKQTVTSMEESYQATVEQEETVKETDLVFQEIYQAMNDVMSNAHLLMSLSEKVNSSAMIMSEKMESIAAVTEESAASSEEVAASTEELSSSVDEVNMHTQSLYENVQELDNLIGQFKLDIEKQEAGIEKAEVEKADVEENEVLEIEKKNNSFTA